MKRKQQHQRQLSVRRVTPELSLRLDRLRKKRGTSLNQTVLDLLCESVGLSAAPWTDRYTQGTPAEVRALEQAVKASRTIDLRDWA